MTPVGKHNCNQLEESKTDYEIVKFWDDEHWVLIDYSSFDDVVPHITIIYCPYCGIKLE